MKTEQSLGPLEEQLLASRRDIDLILNDVKTANSKPAASIERINELNSALTGIRTVVRDMDTLGDELRLALDRHEEGMRALKML